MRDYQNWSSPIKSHLLNKGESNEEATCSGCSAAGHLSSPEIWIGKATSASNGGTMPVDYTARDIVVAYHE
jgi:hypothetical protein